MEELQTNHNQPQTQQQTTPTKKDDLFPSHQIINTTNELKNATDYENTIRYRYLIPKTLDIKFALTQVKHLDKNENFNSLNLLLNKLLLNIKIMKVFKNAKCNFIQMKNRLKTFKFEGYTLEDLDFSKVNIEEINKWSEGIKTYLKEKHKLKTNPYMKKELSELEELIELEMNCDKRTKKALEINTNGTNTESVIKNHLNDHKQISAKLYNTPEYLKYEENRQKLTEVDYARNDHVFLGSTLKTLEDYIETYNREKEYKTDNEYKLDTKISNSLLLLNCNQALLGPVCSILHSDDDSKINKLEMNDKDIKLRKQFYLGSALNIDGGKDKKANTYNLHQSDQNTGWKLIANVNKDGTNFNRELTDPIKHYFHMSVLVFVTKNYELHYEGFVTSKDTKPRHKPIKFSFDFIDPEMKAIYEKKQEISKP